MSDYYNGTNKEEDRQIKFMNKVYDWWESLTNKYQTEIYLDNNPDELLTKEEKAQIRYDRGW